MGGLAQNAPLVGPIRQTLGIDQFHAFVSLDDRIFGEVAEETNLRTEITSSAVIAAIFLADSLLDKNH